MAVTIYQLLIMSRLQTVLDVLTPGWVGSIIGLLGIIAAVVTYFLTRQRTRLAYQNSGDRLLGHSSEGLPANISVQYMGQNIPRLTRTFVVIWNDGEKTISGDDVVTSDPLRIMISSDGQVLSASLVTAARDVCNVQLSLAPQDPTKVLLDFDFLDSGDGAVIEILHTSEDRSPTVSGTIRGLPNGLSNLGRISNNRLFGKRMPWILTPKNQGWIVVGMGIIMVGAHFLVPKERLDASELGGFLVVGMGILYALLGVILLFLQRNRYPKMLHVDELS